MGIIASRRDASSFLLKAITIPTGEKVEEEEEEEVEEEEERKDGGCHNSSFPIPSYLPTYLPGGRSVDRRRLHFHIAVVVTETRIYKGPTPTSVCQRQFFRHHSQFQKEVPRKQHPRNHFHPAINMAATRSVSFISNSHRHPFVSFSVLFHSVSILVHRSDFPNRLSNPGRLDG